MGKLRKLMGLLRGVRGGAGGPWGSPCLCLDDLEFLNLVSVWGTLGSFLWDSPVLLPYRSRA